VNPLFDICDLSVICACDGVIRKQATDVSQILHEINVVLVGRVEMLIVLIEDLHIEDCL